VSTYPGVEKENQGEGTASRPLPEEPQVAIETLIEDEMRLHGSA
jgi:hypothetical protein